MKAKTILIHGYAGHDLSHWLQWLQGELEKQNKDTYFPSYEDSKQPNMTDWQSLFTKELSVSDCEYTFVAHSMGCLVTLKLIENLNIKVKKVVLVACPKNVVAADEKGSLWEKIDGEEWALMEKFFNQDIDWNVINAKASNINFFFSDDDFAVPLEAYDYYKNIFPDANFKVFHNYGHFNRKTGIFTLPEVLELL